jgi:hypothetical protein
MDLIDFKKKNIQYRAALDLHFFGRKLAKIHSDVGCFVELLLSENSKGDQV